MKKNLVKNFFENPFRNMGNPEFPESFFKKLIIKFKK